MATPYPPARPLTRPPEVVAHRGASSAVAEHTLAAYEQAIADGADALECDVRLTRDGVLVCVHDRRVDRTSNGRGVVSTLELADLAELDFGSWHRTPDAAEGPGEDEAPDRDRRRVLTLERLLELVTAASRPVRLAIETKHPTRYAGQVEERLVTLLTRFGVHRPAADGDWPVWVMSFASTSLRRVHYLAPGLPTVLLMRWVPVRYRRGALPPRVAAAGPSIEVVRRHPGYVQRVHDAGYPVHVWTVDDPADVDLVARLGVEAIITNRPRVVLARLGRPAAVPDPGGGGA